MLWAKEEIYNISIALLISMNIEWCTKGFCFWQNVSLNFVLVYVSCQRNYIIRIVPKPLKNQTILLFLIIWIKRRNVVNF